MSYVGLVRESELCQMMYAVVLALVGEAVEIHGIKLWKQKEAFDSDCLEVDLWKSTLMGIRGVAIDRLFMSKAGFVLDVS